MTIAGPRRTSFVRGLPLRRSRTRLEAVFPAAHPPAPGSGLRFAGLARLVWVLGLALVLAGWLGGERGAVVGWLLLGAGVAGLGLGIVDPAAAVEGKFAGLSVELPDQGSVRLGGLLAQTRETEVYRTDRPGVLVKVFDLECGKPDQISYGPYLAFGAELGNLELVHAQADLRAVVPAYYGANIDYARKYAFVAMEYLDGPDLRSWFQGVLSRSPGAEALEEFREAVYRSLAIMGLFHKHGIVLVDFKPEHLIRLPDKKVRLLDLGALFTPQHQAEPQKFVYAATPDHAEVLIDAPNAQTGVPLTAASDLFSAGVTLFEAATGNSRLAINAQTATEILATPAFYLFRDSQIRDMVRAYPALSDSLPLAEKQLQERRLLFADFWPLLKRYLAEKVADWENLPEMQQNQVLLSTGTTFIIEQLPPRLEWLAGPIAQATVLRGLRAKSVDDLLEQVAHPAPEHARQALRASNRFVVWLGEHEWPLGFLDRLNTWDTRCDPAAGHWSLAAPIAAAQLGEEAECAFVREVGRDAAGHRQFHLCGDLEADDFLSGKLTLWHLREDHLAWMA